MSISNYTLLAQIAVPFFILAHVIHIPLLVLQPYKSQAFDLYFRHVLLNMQFVC